MTAQEHGFKTEVQQLLDLMIHSLYSHKEVFLRELISNAADALDKARFMDLTRIDLTPAAGEAGIRVEVDEEAGVIVIEDDGIGMTQEEAIQNLGTIAHSGSAAFLKQMAEARESGKETPGLIGQFGVGFYASFMVAERVQVDSLSAMPGAVGVRWQSDGKGSYTVEPIEKEHRGTRITIYLRDEDKSEYGSDGRVRTIIRKHSNFVSWPIRMGDEQVNQAKAIWHEDPKTVPDEEYNQFFRSLVQDWTDPAFRIRFSVDTPLQYTALLFIPGRRPYDLFHPEADRGPRLYAKRVLIDEHARDILPDWLRFVRGVVDSEDLQLNVSREMVQKTPVVRKIREALTKRVLKELQKLAAAPADQEVEEGATTDRERYLNIWRDFGVLLKEGYYHAHEHRETLLALMRFNAVSHADEGGLMSLDEYRAAMPEGQDTIWYITAANRDAAVNSPQLEVFRKRGWDVLVLTDTVDEWMIRELKEVEGVAVKSISLGDLDLGEDDAKEDEEAGADLVGLIPWMKEIFDGEVNDVRASKRLVDSPAVLVDADDTVSSNMERILRQAREQVMTARRVLELNPRHAVVRNLERLRSSGNAQAAEPLARLLLDDALLLEGTVKDPAAIGRRLQALLEQSSAAALAGVSAVATEPPAAS